MDTVATPTGNRLTASLHCIFTSYSEIKWYKDGVTIEMALLPSYNTTNTSLVVSTTLSDNNSTKLEGLYYCVVNNALGSAKSRSALVTSQYHLPVLLLSVYDGYIIFRSASSFCCFALG